ncbi:MAG: YitT family protein [Lutisporaceae bacterium]
MNKKIKEYLLITLGSVLVAIGIYYFLVPNNLAAGGVSGLAMVMGRYIPDLPIGLMMLVMNIILFIIAIVILGSGFGTKTIYSSLSLSGMIWLFERIMPIYKPLTGDILIELIFGILISAIGMGIIFNQNASTGGTDIIAKMINKYLHVDIGKSLLLSDFVITLLAAIAFDVRTGMYALLGVVMNGFVIDTVIEGLNISKQVMIISSKTEEIKRFILNDLERGATVYSAKGAFTEEEKEIITTTIGRKEVVRLKNFVSGIDKRAFMTIVDAHETLGEGFKDISNS